MKGGGRIFQNFGDELTADVIRYATLQSPRWTPLPAADACVIGSIAELFLSRNSHGLLIGVGVRDFTAPPPAFDTSRVIALRGRLSADRLGSPSAGLGDPGLLAPEVFGRESTKARRHPLVVPHYRSMGNSEVRHALRTLRARGAQIIMPSESPQEVARAIRNASIVIAGSLHALIVAQSYGVPAGLIRFGRLGDEPTKKFDDYLSVFDLHPSWHTAEECAVVVERGIAPDDWRMQAEAVCQKRLPLCEKLVTNLKKLS